MGKRLIWADRLKGILIILVVLGHAIQLTMNDACFENHLWNYIYSFHMAAFMAVSGFLTYRRGGAINSRISLIIRRLRQLIVPFLLWSIIRVLLTKQLSFTSFVIIVLYPDRSFWFLWVLFFITVIFQVGDWISEKLKIQQEIVIIAVGLILVAIMVFVDIRILGFQFIAYYFIFFVLGYYLNKYSYLVTSNRWVLLSLTILWAVMGWFWKMHDLPPFLKGIPFPQTILQYGYRLLTGVIAVYTILGVAIILLNNENVTTPLESLGKVSLGIYVVHIIIMPWIEGVISNYTTNEYIVIPTAFIVALLISWLVISLFGRWRITSRLLLGKI